MLVKAPKWMSKRTIETFLHKHRDWIEQRKKQWQERQRYYYLLGERFERDGEDVKVLWMEVMEWVVVPRAWELARRFEEEPKAIKISRAKKRWGSCSSKKNINLSYRLAQLPMELIDYVIIHELCHLTHMNHSKAFWELVEKRCPDFRKREKELQRFV